MGLSRQQLASRLAFDHQVAMTLKAGCLGGIWAYADENSLAANQPLTNPDQAGLARLYLVEYRVRTLCGQGQFMDHCLVKFDLLAGGTRPVHLGYGREDMARAIYDQACRLAYFTPMQFANPPAIKLAEELAAITPAGIDRFVFECDGSEAVESAMKLAKHYHYYNGEKSRRDLKIRKPG